ncbi:MAG: putative CRISPR-associated protein [Planctomycetota bacterium]|jgi:putative CRISPR-associated protein (TIGR02619 family)|nr:putative CRISPR-associated protein [Planctomycetota bacterium]
MKKLIICTTGTSIANACPSLRGMSKTYHPWESEAKDLRREVADFLGRPENGLKNSDNRRRICAEMNVLDRLDLDRNDRVVLLATDTAEGRVCSEELKGVIVRAFGFGEPQVEVRRIEGLQARNAELLRREGLGNLVKTALEYIADEDQRYSHDIILNPTGGFKGVMPFLVVLGMIHRLRTVYIFESSNELINLPPLPLSFDLKIFKRARPALLFLEERVGVPESAFLGKIPDFVTSERELFMAFTERLDRNNVTLSPLAYCFLEIDKGHGPSLITPGALESIASAGPRQSLNLKRLVDLSASPMWRNQHIEHWHNTDLLVIRRSNTAERLAGFIKDDVFHVALAFASHQEYERELSKHNRAEFKNAAFVEWKNDRDLGVDENDRDALLEDRDRLLLNNEKLAADLTEERERGLERDIRVEALEAGIVALKREREALERSIRELRDKPAVVPQPDSPPVPPCAGAGRGLIQAVKDFFWGRR